MAEPTRGRRPIATNTWRVAMLWPDTTLQQLQHLGSAITVEACEPFADDTLFSSLNPIDCHQLLSQFRSDAITDGESGGYIDSSYLISFYM